MSQIHFVHENLPGTSLDATQVRALRSHVRKVNLERSHQKSTQRLENFRSLTITDFEQDGKVKSAKRRSSLRPDQTQPSAVEDESIPSCPDQPQDCLKSLPIAATPTIAFNSLSSNQRVTLPRTCSCRRARPPHQCPLLPERSSSSSCLNPRHPYASQISKSIDVDEDRIDQLLKSCAFRVAAEPVFTHVHLDTILPVGPAFPECLVDSAFLYALLYSILYTHNCWKTTNESLRLKGHAIKCLKDDLHSDDPALRALSIGTILILCGVAHRSGDVEEYSAHSEGLFKLLQSCREDCMPLSSAILRAVFWQDLLGAALVGDRQRFSLVNFPTIVSQSIILQSMPYRDLPAGFTFHQDAISDVVLSCVREILYLQDLIALQGRDRISICDLQASIESRLVFHERTSKSIGPIAECCRLGAYIVCYMSHANTWNSSFVPLRLAEKLLNLLDITLDSDWWVPRRDLLLWLLLVGVSVSNGDGCFATALGPLYRDFIKRVCDETKSWPVLHDGIAPVQTAVEGFIYAQDWVVERHSIPHWTGLEKALAEPTACAVELEDIEESPLRQTLESNQDVFW